MVNIKLEPKDLEKLGNKVKELYGQGMKDNQIAKTIGMPVSRVTVFRSMLGLLWAKRTSVFSDFRKLCYDSSKEKFMLSAATIPEDKRIELELDPKKSYEYMFYVEKKGIIRIEISQKV